MIIKREAEGILREFAKDYPVVAILGPRQTGKTTLAQQTFPDYRYVSLEDLDVRDFVKRDPRKFLADYKSDRGKS